MGNIGKTVKLGVFTLAIMNVTAVVSLRGLPAEAEYGVSSAFYYLFAAIVFLIPTALVAAELAAMFQDKQGGVFRWVGEAFGKKLGFLAIWLQWVESTIWYPTVLTFGAVSIAFIGSSHGADMSLASNKYYTLAVVLIIYWIATFISLKGLGWVGKVAKVGGMVGTIIPAALLIILAIVYLAMGGQSQMDFSGSFFPDFTKFDNVVLAASIFLFYAGMEMGGIHVKDIENPSKNYPKAVFIGSLITVIIFVLGTFALGIIIPQKDINLTQSLLVGFDNYFAFIHASWFSPIIAIALAFGVLAGVLTWVAGPSKGIFAVGKAGYLPPFFQKTNKIGVQKNILYLQGLAVTLLSLLFVVMPSVQSFYQILSQLTVLLYLIMYLLMFSAAIYLRYNMKKANRPFRIGKKGNGLIWLVAGLGFCGSLLAFILSFIPPGQIATGSNTVWYSVLVIGCIVVVAAPFIIYASRKPTWADKNSQFEPFHWEAQPATTSSITSGMNATAGNTVNTSTTSNTGTKPADTDNTLK
ncbi:putative glutamine/gamma-aminobutyrate antiporter GadC [Coprobacter tertius]|uniref:Amino acid permease n=1 Tax=Coprobacter tertius TaxID=2944915 RepID=A0ABT1MEA2_9BACT|nr:putative glutamine/gamma-aminobutyrate antiporter GadC [Coprobacter tertius]MCP9610952.1 amino acid permease [Coprobacter tertius]